jgi:hypothetical protein
MLNHPTDLVMIGKYHSLAFASIAAMLVIYSMPIPAMQSPEHTIQLTTAQDIIQVRESITISSIINLTDNPLEVWIPSDADTIKISVENTLVSFEKLTDTLYQVNTSSITSSTQPLSCEITYIVPASITTFSKTLQRNTSDFSINFDDKTIFISDGTIPKDVTITVSLPAETDDALFNMYTLTLTVLLIVLLIVSFVYGFRKKQNGGTRTRDSESEDMLSTEKTLLMDVLKQIEKMHRSEKISDDTYHKLKGYYKQQTIEIMKQLDDTQSKTK